MRATQGQLKLRNRSYKLQHSSGPVASNATDLAGGDSVAAAGNDGAAGAAEIETAYSIIMSNFRIVSI